MAKRDWSLLRSYFCVIGESVASFALLLFEFFDELEIGGIVV